MKLSRCAQCNDLLGKEAYTHDLVCDDEKFCSQNCAEKNYDFAMSSDVGDEVAEDE